MVFKGLVNKYWVWVGAIGKVAAWENLPKAMLRSQAF